MPHVKPFTCLKPISYQLQMLSSPVIAECGREKFCIWLIADFQNFRNLDHSSPNPAVCSLWTVPNFLLCCGKVAAANPWTVCCTPLYQLHNILLELWRSEVNTTSRHEPIFYIIPSFFLPDNAQPFFGCCYMLSWWLQQQLKTLSWTVTAISVLNPMQ